MQPSLFSEILSLIGFIGCSVFVFYIPEIMDWLMTWL